MLDEVRIEAAAARADRERVACEQERARTLLEFVLSDDPVARTRVRSARGRDTFELAFSEAAPLVSIVIPTHSRFDLLVTRAIPSVLAQTHRNVELIVVGDQAPEEARAAVAGIGDGRVRYDNLTLRGPYPDDARGKWNVAGGPPFNHGVSLARGRWIAPMADDDAMRPDHLEKLLAGARRDRLELVYGRFEWHDPDAAGSTVLGEFPPREGHITLQAALLHADLSFFELELFDAALDIPNDWAKIVRMWRAGVRIGMIEDVVADVYPSHRWRGDG